MCGVDSTSGPASAALLSILVRKAVRRGRLTVPIFV